MVNTAQRLEILRTEKNISRVQLASELGFAKTAIEKFETGRITPNKEQYERLAKYFGVSAAYLKGEVDEPGGASDWLSGNVADEVPARVAAQTKIVTKPVAGAAEKEMDDGGLFSTLLKSDAFKAAVLDVLKTPEGQALIKIKK